jgi:predicted metal-dependent phosphoesterase TrpH
MGAMEKTGKDVRADGACGAPRSGWDLHCHTVFSDGKATPAQMLGQARALPALRGVAITDHDSTAGWPQAQQAARATGVPLVRGAEITADWKNRTSVHLLAWLFDPSEPTLAGLFARTRAERVERTRRMVEAISHDYPITWEDVLAQAGTAGLTTIGRPHIADALVAAGVVRTRSEAFATIVSGSSKYYLSVRSPAVTEVIAAVKAAGGVIGIAHAASPTRNAVILTDDDIAFFASRGLDALEVWHRENTPEGRARLLRLADRLGLLVTGGSDWHGEGGKPNRLGENLTADDVVEQIEKRGAIAIVR